MSGVLYRTVPTDKIILDTNETAARLQSKDDMHTNETVRECLDELMSVIQCKYSFVRVPVAYTDDNVLNFGFGNVKSKALCANLKGAREVFVFAVTIGIGVDRLLVKLSRMSQSKHFITDALASAAAEAACDIVDSNIKGNLKCRPRFSPGYGDLPIEIQPNVLEMVNAQRLLGITLSKSYLMTPMKSITAIMGICNEQ